MKTLLLQRSEACRYATAGTDAVVVLITTALVPRVLGVVTEVLVPRVRRCFTRVYTQEHAHALLVQSEFNLGRVMAEVAVLTMHTLTYGAGLPLLYPLCGLALLLIVLETKVKLRYVWPRPRQYDSACTRLFLRIVHGMALVHLAIAAWMFSYFRTFGQIVCAPPGALPVPDSFLFHLPVIARLQLAV